MKFSSAVSLFVVTVMAIVPNSTSSLSATKTPLPGAGGGAEDLSPPSPIGDPEKPPAPSLAIVDEWLASHSLNEYGDPLDTMYMGGSPLFDADTGEMKDRYEYLLNKFPDQPWLMLDGEVDVVAFLKIVDEWLVSQSLNEYGDPEGTMYAGLSPLFDENTGEMMDRYEYLLQKFPDQPWLDEVEEEEPGLSVGGGDPPGQEQPGNPELAIVDDWLASQSLNEYGDPIDTMYMGGDPLFNENTGEMMDRYEYLLQKFPDQPWLDEIDDEEEEAGPSSSSTKAPSPGGGDPPGQEQPENPKLAIVDDWLASQSLNEYGDPIDTVYAGGDPLFDENTGEMKDRYEYLLEKFPDQPWLHDVEESIFAPEEEPGNASPPDYPGNPPAPSLGIVDEWLGSQSLNEYGDPIDTMYMGGDPLFDENTGKRKDRYEYLLEKFPDQPWLDEDYEKKDDEMSIQPNGWMFDASAPTMLRGKADITSGAGSIFQRNVSAVTFALSTFLVLIYN